MSAIESGFSEAVVAVQRVAQECGVRILLVGAYARDLLLEDWGSVASMRRTKDVDFGVSVDNWESFLGLRTSLITTGVFTEVAGNPHKVMYREKIEVDLVPFGGVASQDGRLACWPDDFRQEMNVLGYQEALECAARCPIADIPMVTLPAFVGLKILSWNDGPDRRAKDAIDLALLLKSLPANDRCLDAVMDWHDDDWDDIDRRCHRWLGMQLGLVFEPQTICALQGILDRETSLEGDLRLVRKMNASYPRAEDARLALDSLRTGLTSVSAGESEE